MPPAKPRVLCVCNVCGVEFLQHECRVRRGGGKFCSRACQGKSKRNGSVLHCTLCDTAFYRRYGEQDVGIRVDQFCSRECYQAWRDDGRSPNTYPKTGARHTHRIVAEVVLQRALLPGEVVHHIDENKNNHHPLNLAVFPSQSHHMRCHTGGMSVEELYGFSLAKALGVQPEWVRC